MNHLSLSSKVFYARQILTSVRQDCIFVIIERIGAFTLRYTMNKMVQFKFSSLEKEKQFQHYNGIGLYSHSVHNNIHAQELKIQNKKEQIKVTLFRLCALSPQRQGKGPIHGLLRRGSRSHPPGQRPMLRRRGVPRAVRRCGPRRPRLSPQ